MRDWAIVTASILYLVVIGWAYMNRGSEKVVTTLFLGITALAGTLLAVVFFGAEQPIRKVFSTPVMIDAKTHLPFEKIPFSPIPSITMIQARDKLKAHPELIPDIQADPFAQTLYHHLLQQSMITWLEGKYPLAWEADVFPLNLGEVVGYEFQSKDVQSRVYVSKELEQKMLGNPFADLPGLFGSANDKVGLAVPRGTELEISVPHKDPSVVESSRIVLHNHYCTITIETRLASAMVGAGSYRMMLGLDQQQAQDVVKTNQYIVIITATFNRFLTGSPEMPKYRKWASDIANGLESQFDERVMWSQTKEWLLLHRSNPM